MNLRRVVVAGQVRDAIAEMLYVAGMNGAAAKVAMTPASLILFSQASARRRKSPLLQPAFESGARRILQGYAADVRQFAKTDAARRIDERIAKERTGV